MAVTVYTLSEDVREIVESVAKLSSDVRELAAQVKIMRSQLSGHCLDQILHDDQLIESAVQKVNYAVSSLRKDFDSDILTLQLDLETHACDESKHHNHGDCS